MQFYPFCNKAGQLNEGGQTRELVSNCSTANTDFLFRSCHNKQYLAFVFNFYNRCKTSHCENFLGHLPKTFS
jgi:hypothetical protein